MCATLFQQRKETCSSKFTKLVAIATEVTDIVYIYAVYLDKI